MVQIVLVIPAAMQGVILTDVFTLTKLYHATHSATHALWFANLRLCAFVRTSIAAEVHPDTEIQSFHMRRADKTRLGMSASDTWDRTCNPAHGTVPVRARLGAMAIAAPIDGLHGQASEFLIISHPCEYSSVSTRKD